MYDFLNTVLFYIGVPSEVLAKSNPIALILLYVFSTEVVVFFLAVIVWAFIKRGSLRQYERGYHKNNGFPEDMVRRVDVDEVKHSYTLEDMGRQFKGEQRGFFSKMFTGFVLPVGFIYAVFYGLIFYGGDIVNVFK